MEPLPSVLDFLFDQLLSCSRGGGATELVAHVGSTHPWLHHHGLPPLSREGDGDREYERMRESVGLVTDGFGSKLGDPL